MCVGVCALFAALSNLDQVHFHAYQGSGWQPASSPKLWHPTRKNHQGIERESTTTTHHCITMICDPTRKEISKELCVCV
jgi:hypothetical protein